MSRVNVDGQRGWRKRRGQRKQGDQSGRKNRGMRRLSASYTVEAAGVMALVFFTIMVLMNQALRMRAETVGGFTLHEMVERERHAVEQIQTGEITRQDAGADWKLEITAPVFRPENSLRMWSLAEGES